MDGSLKDQPRLTEILIYHVVPGEAMLDNANITKTHAGAPNRVILLVDTVVIPK